MLLAYVHFFTCTKPVQIECDREHSGSVVECLTRDRGRGFELHWRHWVVSLSKKKLILALYVFQPRKTHPFITKRLLMGSKESNQTN